MNKKVKNFVLSNKIIVHSGLVDGWNAEYSQKSVQDISDLRQFSFLWIKFLIFLETKLANRKWRHLLVVVEVLEPFTLDLITLALKMKPCSSRTLEMKMKQSEQICHLNLFLEKKFDLHRLFSFSLQLTRKSIW